MMYDNPEYKGFNRGSKKEIPSGWWDDWDRCIKKTGNLTENINGKNNRLYVLI